jgi:hypothetical protein
MSKLTVWKFPLHMEQPNTFEMPKGAQVLAAQAQLGGPTIWALCNPLAPKEKRTFRIVGTGHEIEDQPGVLLDHVGTFQLYEGKFVGHIFEEVTGAQLTERLKAPSKLGPLLDAAREAEKLNEPIAVSTK